MFWSDGQVRGSGRDCNRLVESPCYQRGAMSCSSCHDMHPSKDDGRSLAEWTNDRLRPRLDGPCACLQRHAEYAEPATLAEHTRHGPKSSGSDCLDCRKPYTTYGFKKTIRCHTITSPSVAATLATGRPNACNQCHLDAPLGFAADKLHEWHGYGRVDGRPMKLAE